MITFAGKEFGVRTVNLFWAALIIAVVSLALLSGFLRPVSDALAGVRFRLTDHEASHTLTVVEIDSRSLQAAGAWPWDRTRYATAIDNLVEAGATLVAFDVDFSAPSTASADEALAAAVSRHPGQVVLANFLQKETYGSRDGTIGENTPLPELRQDALLASVNVPVDVDGKVRSYDVMPSGASQPSLAAVVAGRNAGPGFDIDFGVDHRTIAHLSFEDVLTGDFDRSLVSGRVILIGATAVELGDEFATPAGLIPGVYIHGLAYESLTGGRALVGLHPGLLLALCLLVGILLLPRRDGGASLHRLVQVHALAAVAILIGPVVIQAVSPISLNPAPLMLTQLLFAIWGTRVELERRERAIIAEREAGLLHLAMHEPETELPNRRALLKIIGDTWAASPGAELAIIAVGVERHAEMRGVVGYNVANAVLVQLATRLEAFGATGEVTQLSSSVLAFARTDLDDVGLADLLARLKGLETNFVVEGHSVDIFLRLGAALERGGQMEPEALVERATAALNSARASDDHGVVYDEAGQGTPENNLALMSEMREAIAAGDISLHYQPKMSTADGLIRSVEALCRWRHADRGFLSPDLFISIAEDTGQIRALTEWSIAQALKDHAALRLRGQELTIALNISGRLLADQAFQAKVLDMVGTSGAALCFEITETAVIQQPALAKQALAAFRAAGIKISIDDYGSGLSSLSYLKMLNADELKIDRSLVVDALESQRDRLILKSTVDLAHGLGMSVVAEGVETEELTSCLTLLGCDVIQGYWVSRPLPLPALKSFLKQREAVGSTVPETHSADVVQLEPATRRASAAG